MANGAWRVGDAAECYSVTHNKWCKGEVIEVKSDGVVVRYHVPGGNLGGGGFGVGSWRRLCWLPGGMLVI